ncbi:MAG: hypothetical protein K0S11_514 [Gammaproteobacteria bacterium]|jgi:hypothetical protein|nr:hypothetical protein [Gammaproteobacteria bacterium]
MQEKSIIGGGGDSPPHKLFAVIIPKMQLDGFIAYDITGYSMDNSFIKVDIQSVAGKIGLLLLIQAVIRFL